MAGPRAGSRRGYDGAGPHGLGKAHRRVMLGAAALFGLDQDRARRADFARQEIMEPALALGAQACRRAP